DPDARNAIWARVAKLEEVELADPTRAVATWREILTEDPDHAAALDALERLYQASRSWADLADILRRRVAQDATGPELAKQYLRRIAELQETLLQSPADAINAHLEILEHVPDDPETLVELSRLYRAHARHPDLLDVLERRLQAAPIGEQVALQGE